LVYSIYHGNGLVPVFRTFLHNNHSTLNLFHYGNRRGLAFYGLLSALSIGLWWWLCVRILCHLHWFYENQVWRRRNKIIALVSCVSWIIGLFAWMLSLLIANPLDFALLGTAIIPIWNKSLGIGLVMVIFREFDSTVQRQRRVMFWIVMLSVFLAPYALLALIGGVFALARRQIWIFVLVIPIVISIIGMWCVLMYNTGTFCRKATWCLCTQKGWIVAGMIWFWLLATLAANNNVCFTDAIILEFIFGYRGSTMLVIFFSVMTLIELKYGGAVVSGLAWYGQIRQSTEPNGVDTGHNNINEMVSLQAVQTNQQATFDTAKDSDDESESSGHKDDQNDKEKEKEKMETQGLVRVELPNL